ncbi:hypothetical protein TNCV_808721 [Trichonephila clavipes]|nr:hypothetical protein TNCV_808721 [Trichonephila clavipes]
MFMVDTRVSVVRMMVDNDESDAVTADLTVNLSSTSAVVLASLSRGNKKKCGGLRSGENGGCLICTTLFFYRELFDDIGCVRASIVMKKKLMNLVVRTGVVLSIGVS